MSISFFLWAFYQFQNQSFAFCGKTIRSLRRNLITPVLPILKELGFPCHIHYSENCLSVIFQGRKNRFYLFGGKDEGSAAMIQGITLAGVMFDEVALMPRSFVEQALARCSVEEAKFWFNCNPASSALVLSRMDFKGQNRNKRYIYILRWKIIRRCPQKCASAIILCIQVRFMNALYWENG